MVVPGTIVALGTVALGIRVVPGTIVALGTVALGIRVVPGTVVALGTVILNKYLANRDAVDGLLEK
jgi:hypothetical protein